MTKHTPATRKCWFVFKLGRKWDGPHFTERKADEACVRARQDGCGLVYVEQVIQ